MIIDKLSELADDVRIGRRHPVGGRRFEVCLKSRRGSH